MQCHAHYTFSKYPSSVVAGRWGQTHTRVPYADNGDMEEGKELTALPRKLTEWCEHFKMLDRVYGTDKWSPLHHDNRCDLCAGVNPEAQPEFRLRQILMRSKYMPLWVTENAGYELNVRRTNETE